MSEHAAQTAPENIIDADFTDEPSQAIEKRHALAMTNSNNAMMSPGALREQIARQKENFAIMKEYVESEMTEGHHYGYMSRVNDPNAELKKGEKAVLWQDGALKILNLFQYFPGNVATKLNRDGDHFTVIAEAPIFNSLGHQVATGDGMCSTREVKYAYRKAERTCPECHQPAIMKDNKSSAGGWYCWSKKGGCGKQFKKGDAAIESQQIGRVENLDKADLENTVLKMAIKRATVAAVRKLPLVSDLFTAETGGDDHNNNSSPKGESSQSATKSTPPKSGPKTAQPNAAPVEQSLPMDDAGEAKLRADVVELLNVKFGGDVDEIEKFLNGRNPQVMLVSALEKMRDDLAAK